MCRICDGYQISIYTTISCAEITEFTDENIEEFYLDNIYIETRSAGKDLEMPYICFKHCPNLRTIYCSEVSLVIENCPDLEFAHAIHQDIAIYSVDVTALHVGGRSRLEFINCSGQPGALDVQSLSIYNHTTPLAINIYSNIIDLVLHNVELDHSIYANKLMRQDPHDELYVYELYSACFVNVRGLRQLYLPGIYKLVISQCPDLTRIEPVVENPYANVSVSDCPRLTQFPQPKQARTYKIANCPELKSIIID